MDVINGQKTRYMVMNSGKRRATLIIECNVGKGYTIEKVDILDYTAKSL